MASLQGGPQAVFSQSELHQELVGDPCLTPQWSSAIRRMSCLSSFSCGALIKSRT